MSAFRVCGDTPQASVRSQRDPKRRPVSSAPPIGPVGTESGFVFDKLGLHPFRRPVPLNPQLRLEPPKNWFTKGPTDGIEGCHADRAYLELNLPKPTKPVVVAVIDDGVDISHED